MISKRRAVQLLCVLGIAVLAPTLLAPSPGCDSCTRWSGVLDPSGWVQHSVTVNNGLRYQAFADVASGTVNVRVNGPVTGLSCSSSGTQGWCDFTASSTGQVTVDLTGSPNVAYTLTFGTLPR